MRGRGQRGGRILEGGGNEREDEMSEEPRRHIGRRQTRLCSLTREAFADRRFSAFVRTPRASLRPTRAEARGSPPRASRLTRSSPLRRRPAYQVLGHGDKVRQDAPTRTPAKMSDKTALTYSCGGRSRRWGQRSRNDSPVDQSRPIGNAWKPRASTVGQKEGAHATATSCPDPSGRARGGRGD